VSIQDKLIAWGAGKALNQAENGYPKQTPFARYMLNPGDTTQRVSSVPPISDDEHIRIDGVICALGQRKPAHYEIICLHYLSKVSDIKIARVIGIGKTSVRSMRENAEFWIEAKLDY